MGKEVDEGLRGSEMKEVKKNKMEEERQERESRNKGERRRDFFFKARSSWKESL